LDALRTVPVDPDRNGRDGGAENSIAETLGLHSPLLAGRFRVVGGLEGSLRPDPYADA
jgi:hypothetical protein